MRLNRLLAISVVVASSAMTSGCARTSGEPLSARERFNAPNVGASDTARTAVGLREANSSAAVVDTETQPTDPFRAELQATVSYASDQAFVAADAGLGHNLIAAEDAAVVLADAAALVAQRVSEMQASTSSGDCGCGGCADAPAEIGDPAIDDAVLFSALAAEAAADIATELNPPTTTICGCHCEEVPGSVDEVALGDAIDAAVDAGEGCASTSDAIQPL